MALNATIDLTVKKPDFKSMKSEIRELTVAAQQAVMQFGEFSPEAVKAEHALAGARDRMEDFNDRVAAVNPDGFARINTVIQGVARGFQAAQGAMALFGNDSEALEKTMVKLQAAMALAEGLEGLGQIQQQFRAIFTEVVSGAKKAFAAIRAGIGSTGIGLIVIALGAIVAYWDDIKEAVSGVSDEQKDLLKNTEKTVLANEKSYDNISKSENILKQQGKTEKEILQLKIASLKVSIKDLSAKLQAQESIQQSQIDTAKRNKDILQGMIRFIFAPLSILLKAVDAVGTALGQDFGLEEGFSGGIAKMVFDPKEVQDQSNAAIQTSKDALLKMQNDVAGFEESIKGIDKKAVEDKKKIGDDAAEKELDRLAKLEEDKKKMTNDALSAEASAREAARQKELALITDEGLKIKKEYTNKLASLQEAKAAELKAVGDNAAAIAAIDQKYRDLDIVALAEFDAAKLKLAEDNAAKKKVIDDKEKDDQAKATADQLANEEALMTAKAEMVTATRNAVLALGGLFKEGSDAAKAAALVDIAIGTGVGFINALDIAQKGAKATGPAAPFAFPIFYASQIAAVLGAANKAKAILKSGKGGGSASAPSQMGGGGMPQTSAPNISSSLPSVSGFDTKVFVTEGDIRRTTDRVDSTRKVSVVK